MNKDTLKIIRELAKKAAEISALPEQEEKSKAYGMPIIRLMGEKPLISDISPRRLVEGAYSRKQSA